MKIINQIKNAISHYTKSGWPRQYSYDVLPPREMRAAMTLPWVRETMIRFSKDEYERNPYYASVINKVAEQVIGPCPTMIGIGERAEDNDLIEDSHLLWCQQNRIGKSLREFRKQAALTGIGLMLPVKIKTDYPVKIGLKVYGGDVLVNPPGVSLDDRIVDGIEYNDDWEPVKFYFRDENFGRDPKEYSVDEVIYWSRGYESGCLRPIPECVSAFQIYPYIRRYLQAAIEGEEFRTSFPMALELDKTLYSKNTNMMLNKLEKFSYQPRSVPTLPVGTELKGLPAGANSQDVYKMLRAFGGAAALSIDMPVNLAIGDSSNSNMATAQVDTQPWKNRVNTDRFDLEPELRRSTKVWYTGARNVRGLTPAVSREDPVYRDYYPHKYVYAPLFQHPDPQKNAKSRELDLTSGVGTLNQIYSELGKNARRELQADATLMGITYEDLMERILEARASLAARPQGEESNANTE